MGPTILFASRIGKRAYGLEPDPTAYSFLKGNVEANPSLNSRVKVFQRCISNSWEVVSMYGAGSSISFLVKENDTNKDHLAYTEKFPEKKFTVYCMPLWEFLRDHDAETDDTFIKMDVEGAERFVIPSYIKWLSEYPHKHKPAFFISMHKFETFTEEQRADIFTVIRMYKYYGYPWERDGDVILHSTTEFKERHLPEIFLTDRSLDEYPPPRSSTP
jgi:FkbM family methyltransferase